MNLSSINPLGLPSLPLERRSQLPTKPGIYFELNNLGQVRYIGRSINIRQRWVGHHRWSELKNIDSGTIAWLEVNSSPEIRAQIEVALIDWFNPPFNAPITVVVETSDPRLQIFARAFKEVMFQYKLSAVELANASGVSTSQISRFRKGDNLRIDSVEKLLWALPPEAYKHFFELLKSSF